MRVCLRCRSVYHPGARFCGIDGQPLEDFSEDPLIGQRLDRYQVTALIGRGGCGSVYRAVHNELGSDFAIKVLYGHLAADSAYVERFRREAQAVSKIRSPWVVSVVDFGATETGLTYLVMEYSSGTTLERLCARNTAFEPKRAARIVAQVASGLAVAHRLGFVHRDVKPANIAVEVHEGKEWAKLLDFGIVRLPEIDGSDKLTKEGTVLGTPAYMSPEQAAAREVTAKSDLYSLGVVLYQLLAGRKPFLGNTHEVMSKHHNEPPPPLPIGGSIAELTYALLQKDPAMRPADASVVAESAKRIEVELRGGDPSVDPLESEDAPAPPTFSHTQRASYPPLQLSDPSVGRSQPISVRSPWPIRFAFGASLLAIAGAGAVWLAPRPAAEVVEVVDREPPSLEAQEKALAEVLAARGLVAEDLPGIPGAGELHASWQASRGSDAGAARGALERLIALVKHAAISGELLAARLDRLDAEVAALGGRMAAPDFERIKTEYLDLYRIVRLASTEEEREVVGQAIGRFEEKLRGL